MFVWMITTETDIDQSQVTNTREAGKERQRTCISSLTMDHETC